MSDVSFISTMPVTYDSEVVWQGQSLAGATPTRHVASDHIASNPVQTVRRPAPELDVPFQHYDVRQTAALIGALGESIALLLMLLKFSRESREQAVMLRDVENRSMIFAQKAQAAEMRKGVGVMIAMAVVSGVMAVGSAAVGSWGAYKNGKVVSMEKASENVGVDPLRSMEHEFTHRSNNVQSLNALNQSSGQVANNALQGKDKGFQAAAKGYEVDSTMAQHEKQKVDDRLGFSTTFMKDVIQMLQQLTQSHNQALRTAAGVV